jgi:hypothetical protein
MTIISQLIIAVVVVGIYHFWVTARKQPMATVEPAPRAESLVRAQPVALPVLPNAQPAPVTPPVVRPAVSIQPIAATVEPEIIAVIAAAVAVVLGRPYRVVSVQASPLAPQGNVWALEGRIEQFMSHRVR